MKMKVLFVLAVLLLAVSMAGYSAYRKKGFFSAYYQVPGGLPRCDLIDMWQSCSTSGVAVCTYNTPNDGWQYMYQQQVDLGTCAIPYYDWN